MDAVNPFVKDLFEKTSIKNLDAYDVIGFDVDHCLVQYNVPIIHAMTYRALTTTLIKDLGYPDCLQELSEEQMNFPLNASICDFKTGCILKLGEGNIILRAYRGFQRLSDDEVKEIYGNPPVMHNFLKEEQGFDDYFSFITFFDTAFLLVFAAINDLVKRKIVSKTNAEIRADVWYAHRNNYMYWNYDTKEMFSMPSYGHYYPQIVKNPELYIRKRDDVALFLQKLREKGKKLFIATNAHYDYCNFTMSYAFGKDWRKLFDLCITGARKPNFFKSNATGFRKADKDKSLFYGEEVKAPLEMNGEYVLGNYEELEKTFEAVIGKDSLKYVYLGDNYVSDCYWSARLKNWQSVVVVEELARECGHEGKKDELLKYQRWWGSFFFEETAEKVYHPTVWSSMFLRDIKYAVPNLNYFV